MHVVCIRCLIHFLPIAKFNFQIVGEKACIVTVLIKGNGNIAIFLFSRLKELLRLYIILFLPVFFHILLSSTNILSERNEMSAIFNSCRYACHVTTGVTQYFYL